MGLAHTMKVPLSLLGTPRDLALPRFSPMPLTHPLRLYNLGTSFDSAISTLVFRGSFQGEKVVHFIASVKL